jgi:hypothetical protein
VAVQSNSGGVRGGEKMGLTCGVRGGREDGADMWGPHVSAGEREGGVARRRKPKEKVHSSKGAMGHVGLLGWQGWWWPRMGVGRRGGLGQLGQNQRRVLIRKMIFEF